MKYLEDYLCIINKWVEFFNLNNWAIKIEPISPSQVSYDDDVPQEDRYFIGINRDEFNKKATIYYDREMNEEDILHELIHLKFPSYTEKQVNEYCDELLS